MNKLIRERAARWARALILREHTVRNWTHGDARAHLEAAWLAGARSLDQWHRERFDAKLALAIDIRTAYRCYMCGKNRYSDDANGTPGEVLTIPALGSRPKRTETWGDERPGDFEAGI